MDASLRCLALILVFGLFFMPGAVFAREKGVYGTNCSDSQHSVEPQTVAAGAQIKFLSSGHNRVADMTTGGLVVNGWQGDAVYQQRSAQKIGTVSHTNENGTQFLERVHAVNENGKNVDYYTAAGTCGSFTWSHGWECSEPEGQVFDCSCVSRVSFNVCGAGQSAPSATSAPVPSATTKPQTPSSTSAPAATNPPANSNPTPTSSAFNWGNGGSFRFFSTPVPATATSAPNNSSSGSRSSQNLPSNSKPPQQNHSQPSTGGNSQTPPSLNQGGQESGRNHSISIFTPSKIVLEIGPKISTAVQTVAVGGKAAAFLVKKTIAGIFSRFLEETSF